MDAIDALFCFGGTVVRVADNVLLNGTSLAFRLPENLSRKDKFSTDILLNEIKNNYKFYAEKIIQKGIEFGI